MNRWKDWYEQGKRDHERALLDIRYYIPPRYPSGFASGKPADYFTEAQAREALDAADQIIRFCEGHLPGSG